MAPMLYWIVYHLDLGRIGPKALDLAVRVWLRRARNGTTVPAVKRRSFGGLTSLHLEPNLGADERM